MEMEFGIVAAPSAFLYAQAGEPGENCENELTDEMLSGWAFRVLEQTDDRAWLRIRTFYGYEGWIRGSLARPVSGAEMEERQDKKRFLRIASKNADILCRPKVQGQLLETLPKDSIVEKLEEEPEGKWVRIRSASGKEGWVFSNALTERKDSDAFLLGKMSFCQLACECRSEREEEELREGAVLSAMSYLGTQYRWGGKSPEGIDCSGLVFMSWMEQGILIYRDAHILPEYPVRRIGREELRKGDLIFFPGHVGMYIGEDRFIHATAWYKTPCVTISSLRPGDEDYRADLDASVTMCGSLFCGQDPEK